MTNGDYIRSMSDNELVKILDLCCFCNKHNVEECDGKCEENIIEWLKQERKEGEME